MPKRFIFIHGNDTMHWSGAWGAWAKEQISSLGFETFFETFPDSIYARAKYWLPFLEDSVKAGENDIIIGWSSGAVATMRYSEDHKIDGSILIAPSYTHLNDPLEKESGYYDRPWEWGKIKQNQEKIALIYSDDDPYIPQADFEEIAKQLNTHTIKISGKKHFMESTTLPELLDYIKKNY